MNKRIINYFKKKDPILFSVLSQMEDIPDLVKRQPSQYFASLCDEIISQQLSGKVANIIFNRFKNLFPNQKITPQALADIDHSTLRAVGMSTLKAAFIKDLAEKFISNEVDLNQLAQMSDEEVIKTLTKIKGVGSWTAEMFLMFTLGRTDVFSTGDLGLKNAIKRLYKIENLTKEQLEEVSSQWKPYRTYACMILWKSVKL